MCDIDNYVVTKKEIREKRQEFVDYCNANNEKCNKICGFCIIDEKIMLLTWLLYSDLKTENITTDLMDTMNIQDVVNV